MTAVDLSARTREAARKLRETAAAATEDSWVAQHWTVPAGKSDIVTKWRGTPVATTPHKADASWIALMSPDKGGLLADLLDGIAERHQPCSCGCGDCECYGQPWPCPLLAVQPIVDALLGEEKQQ